MELSRLRSVLLALVCLSTALLLLESLQLVLMLFTPSLPL
jgi:hypothetical protein